DRWFPGPVSHPYPGVSSCRTDSAFQGDPRLPVVGLPNCVDMPWGTSLSPVTTLGGMSPGVSTDTFEALGIPIPENYSAPSTIGLEDTVGVHMQAFRLGGILFTVCSCEQWVEQSYNVKTRTDRVSGNEYVGYDATSPNADPSERCTRNGDGTYKDDGSGTGMWTCSLADLPAPAVTQKFPDKLIEHMRAQVLNDATRWDDPTCSRLGCGAQAESEPPDLTKVFGNYTHDDTTVRGGQDQGSNASKYGYKLTVTIAMANDYNGYIASYREYMDRDHYRKALTGWGPHSSDYYATRLTQMGEALNGDSTAGRTIEGQTDPGKADPASAPGTYDPAAIANGMAGYRAGGQVWKWTGAFEAFVSRFPLVDPQGHRYTATPTGTYRFVVHGVWRKGNADVPYTRVSNSFRVKPWKGITVNSAGVDGVGHVTFAAGPSHEIKEQTVRRTARPPFLPGDAPVTFKIGPVDFPDTVANQKATG